MAHFPSIYVDILVVCASAVIFQKVRYKTKETMY